MYLIKQIIAIILSIFEIISPFVVQVFTNSGKSMMYEWSTSMEFTESHYIEIDKHPDEDFKILNLTDIQIYDDDIYHKDGIGEDCLALVSQTIEDQKPDLITVSGDSFCSTLSTLKLIKLIDSYEIPWAPILGNHDGGNVGKWVFWAAWHLSKAKYSLFEFGPEGMGYGNYIINITENGNIIHSLYLMDTHNTTVDYIVEGEIIPGYDHLWENQIAWYEWAVQGNERLAGHPVQSTVILHGSLYEQKVAWQNVATDEKTPDAPLGNLKPEYSHVVSGHSGEYGGYPPISNGFFDKVKELGSTKDIITGHDHLNDYSIIYEGVRLTYALKTGNGDYYREDMLGATVYTINSEGQTHIGHVYYTFSNGMWITR